MNLAEGLQIEIARNQELLTQYAEIGSAGTFASAMIKADLATATKAILENDIVTEIKIYEKLKGNE